MSKKKASTLTPRAKAILIAAVALLLVAAIVLTTVLLLLPRDPVLSYGGITVTAEMYAFWFSIAKTDFMAKYGIKSYEDTASRWDSPSEVEGKTWGQLLTEEVDRSLRMRLIAAAMYDALGLADTSQRAIVNDYCEEALELKAGGDKDAYRALCEKYGTTERAIKKCAAIDVKAELLYEYLSARTGEGLTNTEKHTFYVENYVRFKVLYLNSTVRGEMVNGERVETTLTEAERANVQKWDTDLSAYLLGGSKEGEMTEEIFETYLKNSHEALHASTGYPDGLYTSRYINLRDVNVLENEVVEELGYLKEGELLRVETEDGIRYLYGYHLLTAPYNAAAFEEFFLNFHASCAAYTLARRTAAELSRVKTYEENLPTDLCYRIPANLVFDYCAVVN
ncbi:MAG: hypothetical protein IJF73_02710 [Clostridia bacterium]|nr:hypothetical protein [Clostridia bacterium]